MALTREYIRKLAKESDVELPKEFIDGIISEHTTARDAYADEQVKTALENNKSEPQQVNVKESQEYKDLEKQFNDYKTAQTAKETRAAKDKAYRALLTAAGVHEKRIDVIMKVTNLDEIELDKDGKIKDADKHTETVKSEYADFIVTKTERGADVATPPANNGGHTGKTKEEIMAIRDPAVRQAEIAKNPEAFGLKFD